MEDKEKLHRKIVTYLFPLEDSRLDSYRPEISGFNNSYDALPKNIHNMLHLCLATQHNLLNLTTDLRNVTIKYWRGDNTQNAYIVNVLRKFYLQTAYSAINFWNLSSSPTAPINSYDISTNYYRPVKLSSGKLVTGGGKKFDYVIVGSGPAGSTIAYKLVSTLDVDVLLIERGPFIDPNIETEYRTDLFESHNLRTNDNSHLLYIRNGQAVGGGTAINVNLAFSPLLPSIKAKIAQWVKDGIISSEFIHDTDGDYKKLERAYEWVQKKIGTREIQDNEVNINNQILRNGTANSAKYNLNQHYSKEQKRFVKTSAVDALLLEALFRQQPGRLSILPEFEAAKIHYSGLRVDSIETVYSPHPATDKVEDINQLHMNPNDTVFVEGNAFIICAGTLGSTELLLRSELPNSKVGKGLIMHPSLGMAGIFNRSINITEGLPYSVYATSKNASDEYFFESMDVTPAFLATIHPGNSTEILDTVLSFDKVGGFGIMLVDTVDDNNRVYLGTENGKKAIAVSYTISDNDKERLKTAMCEASKILFEQGAQRIFTSSIEDVYASDTVFFHNATEACNAIQRLNFSNHLTTMSSAHMQGTNKLGAVVSKSFKFINNEGDEFSNLFVCDSSVFPTSIGANPMQSVYTFAALFSNDLIRDFWNNANKDLQTHQHPQYIKDYLEDFLQKTEKEQEELLGKFNQAYCDDF